ncbi:hypothetical protein ELG79_36600 [Rhizobium leguminosarum]|uniref:hypothetical protein n=1 Tax=Rhizobium leguminosarum TaxID=384 RepID=UPI0010311602|nr:hypothetical protein [Rhizobium leguminosarum]TBG08444.1 hypothetical protein ELG79_36600 [Rhizobium leguminosarum]
MNWTDKISGCFGESDLIFAGHPNDEQRAFDLLVYLRKEKMGWGKVRAEFEAFLDSEMANEEHKERQLAKVEVGYRSWLLD